MNKFWKTKHQLRTLLFLKWWSVIFFHIQNCTYIFEYHDRSPTFRSQERRFRFFLQRIIVSFFSSRWLHISNYPALYTYAKISQAGTAPQHLHRLLKTVIYKTGRKRVMKPQPKRVLCSYGHGRYGENVGYYWPLRRKKSVTQQLKTSSRVIGKVLF